MKWHLLSFTLLCCIAANSQPVARTGDSLTVKQYLEQSREAAKKNIQLAFDLTGKALTLSESINHYPGIADAENSLGDLYLQAKKPANALTHFEKAKTLFQKTNNDYSLGRVYKSIGDVYALQSYFRQSFDNYREAVSLLRKTGQLKLMSECQEAMGRLSLEFGQAKNAATTYRRLLLTYISLNDQKGIMATTSKLTKVYLASRQYDSALYFTRDLQRQTKDDSELKTDAVIDELIILSFQGKIAEALTAKSNAERLVQQQGNPANQMKLLAAISGFHMAQKDKAMSKKYFDSAAALIQQSRSVELAITGLGLLAEMSNQHEDFATAFRMLKQMDKYKDIFRNENMERISAEIKNTAEASLKEKEIEYLNLANKLKAEQLSKEEIKRLALLRENILKDSSLSGQQLLMAAVQNESELRAAQLQREKELSLSLSRENRLKQQLLNDERRNKSLLWVGIGVLTLAGVIIFFQYQRQRNKNNIIHKQSKELEVLNKEIHHRVKNNLQVISSMLDLQSQSLNDAATTAIMKEGIQRVQSMAFIHQNLYQGNSVNSVNMNEYIKTLSTHLFQTYNIRTDKIRLHTQIEDLKLHTDTAIPLGMVLNELISNALKYAFNKQENGDIWVTMKKNDNELLLQVKDNGAGLPEGFNPEHSASFGYEIIKAFSQKLKARMKIDGSNGTDVQIIISKFKTTG